ncbi:MAG: hypothetical protein U5J96_07945 [Ignavibacteriaceae bacterium]|nr:hypothetical protein [Ignavibacteriaceae bacterium]
MMPVLYRVINLNLFLIILAFFIPDKTFAQVELFGFGGYQVASDVAVAQGDLNVYSNPNYGASIAFEVDRGLQAELLWIGQQTTMDLKQLNGITKPLFDIGIHYFQLGAIYEFKQNSMQKVFPFTSFSLGATMFTPHGSTYSDEWRFSITFGGGGKFYLSDKIGLRLQARLLLPINFSSVGMWCGSGGCSATVGSWATFVQADFTGGIFVRLGK